MPLYHLDSLIPVVLFSLCTYTFLHDSLLVSLLRIWTQTYLPPTATFDAKQTTRQRLMPIVVVDVS